MTSDCNLSAAAARPGFSALCILRRAAVCMAVLVSANAIARAVSPEPPSSAAKTSPDDKNWPHLRGPHYDAHAAETDLADAWPADGPPLLWMREIGDGYSALIVVGDRAYTQTQTLTEQKVLALDADTGQTIWERSYGWSYEAGGMYPGPRATPTWSHGRLYFAAPDGLVGCLLAADGTMLWSVNVLEQFGGRGADFGYSCSPLVEDGRVILPVGGPDAAVVALNAVNGATMWAAGNARASYCSAMPITINGQRQVAAFLRDKLLGCDLHTGRVLWQQTCARGYAEHAAWPLFAAPYLRIMRPFRAGSDLYELDAAAQNAAKPQTLRLVRHDRQMSNDVASSVLVDGYVYGFDVYGAQTSRHRPTRGAFRCMDFVTGEIRWSSDRPGQAAIVAADGKLFLFNDSGEVLLIRASPEKYEELGRHKLFYGEICWTAPALQHGRLFLRSPTRAACLYVGRAEHMTPRQRTLAATTSVTPQAETWREADWLVGAEREYPFELPDARELMHWYLYSLGVLAAAGALALLFYGGCRLHSADTARRCARFVFAAGLVPLGIAATPLSNACSCHFVFTWPVALFAVHQIALTAVLRSRRRKRAENIPTINDKSNAASLPAALASEEISSTRPRHGRLTAWAGVLLLVCACYLYYRLTRAYSLAPAWYFLVTFLAVWPAACPVAQRLLRPGRLTLDILGMFFAFSIYFWISGGLMLWRAAVAAR